VLTLWIVLAVLTFLAVAFVLVPLRSLKQADADPTQVVGNDTADLAVYRAQLGELEQDLQRGLISDADAEAARIEISRRLLTRVRSIEDDSAATPNGKADGEIAGASAPSHRRLAAFSTIVAVPAAALSLYLVVGSPNLPGQPLAERMAETTDEQGIDILVARVEAHLAENPEDGRGWEVVAPVYRRLGRVEDAARAFRNTIRLLGSNAERQSDLGEMLVAARDGVVNDDARAAFTAALEHEPRTIKARYYLGIAAEQDGDEAAAKEIWRALVTEDGDPEAIWRQVAQERLAALGETPPAVSTPTEPDRGEAQSDTAQSDTAQPETAPQPTQPGPTEDDIAAARDMNPEDRMSMIRGMVEALDARLAEDGSDVDGWLRLMRAYAVLNEPDKAAQAVERARTALADDDAALQRIDEAAKSLQILN
jgi:cytochrome c-type biogenesis protein CcmH